MIPNHPMMNENGRSKISHTNKVPEFTGAFKVNVECDKPMDCFSAFFTEEVMDMIVKRTWDSQKPNYSFFLESIW